MGKVEPPSFRLIGVQGRGYNTETATAALGVARFDEFRTGLGYDSIQLREILVPLDGSQASLDALALACTIAKRNRGRVYAVYVIEVARTLPLDADLTPEARRGEEILSQAERLAESLDFEVTGELLQARDAGHAIVDEAIERGVDGVVLGMGYEMPLGEFQMGRTAQYVLKNAPCEVLLARSPATGKSSSTEERTEAERSID